MFVALGRFIYRRRLPVLAAWLVFLAVSVAVGIGLFDALADVGYDDPASDAARAAALVHQQFEANQSPLIVMFTSAKGAKVDDPAYKQAVAATLDKAKSVPGVGSVTSYYDTGAKQLVSTDQTSTYAIIELPSDRDSELLKQLRPLLTSDALTVRLGGAPVSSADVLDQVGKDIASAEMITLPIVALLLIVIFGSLVAAGLPLAIGGVAILGAFLMLRLLTYVTDISAFAVNVVTMLGLGLAIDYSLFMVNRFREELGKQEGDIGLAVVNTVRTAGRTVLFSGLTVTISLFSLLFFPQPILRSIGWGGAVAVLIAMLAALTLLPALLTVLGNRVNALSLNRWLRQRNGRKAENERGFWYGLSNFVMRRPVTVLLLTLIPMLIAGSPFLHVQFATPDYHNLPKGRDSRTVSEMLLTDFPQSDNAPIQIVVENNGDALSGANVGSLYDYTRALQKLSGVTRVESPVNLNPQLDAGGKQAYASFYANAAQNPAAQQAATQYARGRYSLVNVIFSGPPSAAANQQLVRDIRALPPPAGAITLVGGDTASLVDLLDGMARTIPFAFGGIALAIFVLLFLMLGSLIVPIKALLLNVLSLSVSIGAIVWVFQDGNLANLLDFDAAGSVDPTMPVLIFSIAFGLSMDYEVFLLSRIKESYDATSDNTASVALGVQKTGAIITSAAALLVMVLLGFGLGSVLQQKQIALGLCLAILVDATLVRMLLVPATMRLLGKYNWWAPQPLVRLYRKLGLGESEADDSMSIRSSLVADDLAGE